MESACSGSANRFELREAEDTCLPQRSRVWTFDDCAWYALRDAGLVGRRAEHLEARALERRDAGGDRGDPPAGCPVNRR